jgi:hypothetical protein
MRLSQLAKLFWVIIENLLIWVIVLVHIIKGSTIYLWFFYSFYIEL